MYLLQNNTHSFKNIKNYPEMGKMNHELPGNKGLQESLIPPLKKLYITMLKEMQMDKGGFT